LRHLPASPGISRHLAASARSEHRTPPNSQFFH